MFWAAYVAATFLSRYRFYASHGGGGTDAASSRKRLKTIIFPKFEMDCDDAEGHRDDSFLDDPKRLADAFASAARRTAGTGSLTPEEFEEDHCDEKVARKLANARNRKLMLAARDPTCEHDALDPTWAPACRGGLYVRRREGANPTVAAAPEGFFSPEFQTCLLRCPPGASVSGRHPPRPRHRRSDETPVSGRISPRTLALRRRSSLAGTVQRRSTTRGARGSPG